MKAVVSVTVAFSAKAVPVLLTELAVDELTQGADEVCETGQAWAYSLDIPPRDLNPHIVVAPRISTMGETHPPSLAGPEIAAPIGDTVTMFLAEIVDKHFLNPRGK